MEFNQAKRKVRVIWNTSTGWAQNKLRAALRTRTWGVGWQEAWHEPAECTCNPEGQMYSGLHWKKCDQQVKRGDFTSLCCSYETSPRILCPDLGPPTKEGCGAIGVKPEMAKKMINGLEHLWWWQAEWVGVIHPGEK